MNGNNVRAFKGFDKDLKCRNFQYEVGKTYEHNGHVKLCDAGFHACEDLWDVLNYYPITSRFCEVEMSGNLDKGSDKIASSHIYIKAEIGVAGWVKVACDVLWRQVDPKNIEKVGTTANVSTDNDNGRGFAQIGSSGNSARIGSSGDSARIGSSGYSAQIGSSGNSARIGSSGDSARIGSSGYSAQIGSSGNSARIGSSGDSARIGSSGDSAQIGSSGYSAQIGSSGNSAQIGSSGYSAQIGSSGYSAQIGSSGNSAQIGSSGYSAQIGSSGNPLRLAAQATPLASPPSVMAL